MSGNSIAGEKNRRRIVQADREAILDRIITLRKIDIQERISGVITH